MEAGGFTLVRKKAGKTGKKDRRAQEAAALNTSCTTSITAPSIISDVGRCKQMIEKNREWFSQVLVLALFHFWVLFSFWIRWTECWWTHCGIGLWSFFRTLFAMGLVVLQRPTFPGNNWHSPCCWKKNSAKQTLLFTSLTLYSTRQVCQNSVFEERNSPFFEEILILDIRSECDARARMLCCDCEGCTSNFC